MFLEQSDYRIRTLTRNVKFLREDLADRRKLNNLFNEDFAKVVRLAKNNIKAEQCQDAMNLAIKVMLEKHPEIGQKYSAEINSTDKDQLKNKDKALKKMYKKAVMECHPDRHASMGISEEEAKKKMKNLFQKARTAYDDNDVEEMISVCIDLDLDLHNLDMSHQALISYLETATIRFKREIEEIDKSFTWVWGHSCGNVEMRIRLLSAYLIQTGHPKISDTILKDIIEHYESGQDRTGSQRGERPKKLIRT